MGTLDHLVVTTPKLADGVAWVEAALGVAMQPGGRHAAMGTHNALLRLTDTTYLEVLAIVPDAPAPSRPRWFGLDGLASDAPPRLATWVVRADDLDAAVAVSPEPLGDVLAMSRGPFAWRITIPPDGQPPLDGLVPALISWSTAHPAAGLADLGCRLHDLEARHPDPARLDRALRALDARDATIAQAAPGEVPSLVAMILTPGGLRRLGPPT